MAPVLQGRVFTRLHQFAELPAELQEDTIQFRAHAVQEKDKLFQTHHALVKPVFSVKGKALVDTIIQWLQAREAARAQTPATVAEQAVSVVSDAVDTVVEAVKDMLAIDDDNAAPAETTATTDSAAPASTASDAAATTAPSETPAPPASATTPVPVPPELREHARQIAEALVLSGFLTLHKDDEKHLNAAAPDYYVRDNELLIPVAKGVSELKTTSVWDVAAGAIHASFLKRKAGFLAPFTQGKDVYVVFNEKTDTATMFESDLARAPIADFEGKNYRVQYDRSHFEFGVRVTLSTGDEKEKPELFNALSKPQQEEFLNEWLNIGAQYYEASNASLEAVKSIYELKDYDMSGNEVSMDKYKGKVLLVVNVSSKCGLTPTNYPELAELDKRYRDQGLEILAFPCNQFAGQEPGTHDEIMEFVKQYNCEFPFFEKHDVNGADARPVFTYLKAKLPGSFGNFVKWNFTKFLVDRNGQPYKRFAPKDLPFSFEDDIKALLAQEATPADAPTKPDEEIVVGFAAASDVVTGEDHVTTPEETQTQEVTPVETKTPEQPIAAAVAPAAT